MTEDIDAMIERVGQDAVRSPIDGNGLDGSQRLRVPHGDRFAGGEAVMEERIRRGSVALVFAISPSGFRVSRLNTATRAAGPDRAM